MPLQGVLEELSGNNRQSFVWSGKLLVHHSSDIAGEFSCKSSLGDIGFFAAEDHVVVFASQTFVVLVCVSDDLRRIALLTLLQWLGFITDLSSPITLGGFDQQPPHIDVACLGDARTFLSVAAGIFAGGQTEDCRQEIENGNMPYFSLILSSVDVRPYSFPLSGLRR